MRHRRDDKPAIALERDEALVKQMIDGGRKQKAVFTREPIAIGTVAPRANVARNQVLRAIDPRYSTRPLNLANIGAKDSLAATRLNDG